MSFWQGVLLVGEMTAILGAFVLVRVAIYLRDRVELEKELRKWREQMEEQRKEYKRRRYESS